MTIKKLKTLGEGGQGTVNLVEVDGDRDANMADKSFSVLKNKSEAEKCL